MSPSVLPNSPIRESELKSRHRRRPGSVDWTRELIITAIRKFHKREGRWPIQRDFTNANGLPCHDTVTDRCGDITHAKLAAGWVPAEPKRTHSTVAFIERRGQVPVAPIVEAVLGFMREHNMSVGQAAVEIFGGDPKTFSRRLHDIFYRQHFIRFGTADRILCAIRRQDLWRTDPELAAAYQDVELPDECPICGVIHGGSEEKAA